MRIALALMLLLPFSVGCSPEQDIELAREYRIELEHFDNAMKFSKLNMNSQAQKSCDQLDKLKSECYTTLVQEMMVKNIKPPLAYCDAIAPGQKMQMSMRAFKIAYQEVDETLKAELKEKLNPSTVRIERLQVIKNNCYALQ